MARGQVGDVADQNLVWSVVFADQVDYLLAAATACGSAWVVRSGRVPGDAANRLARKAVSYLVGCRLPTDFSASKTG